METFLVASIKEGCFTVFRESNINVKEDIRYCEVTGLWTFCRKRKIKKKIKKIFKEKKAKVWYTPKAIEEVKKM